MNEQQKGERVVDMAKRHFDESVESLDAAALSKLNRARHEALAQVSRPNPAGAWVRWMPATGIAAAAVVALMVMRGPMTGEFPEVPEAVSDFEILLDVEHLEMLEELEFYSWLDSSELTGSGDV